MNSHDRVFHENTNIISRPKIAWPDNQALAFAVVVCVEYYELQPPADAFIPPNLPGGFGRGPYPDFRAFTQREYGNRVGIFRVIEALDRSTISATVAVDASVARRYPYLIRQFRQRNWPMLGHGISLTQVISNKMSEEEERNYIKASLDEIEKQSGTRPLGWHGPEYGELERTPEILAGLGVRYVLDWPNDEQPYLMRTEAGSLVSIPMALELDDVIAHYHRRISMKRWKQGVIDAIDQLASDGRQNGRHLVLNLHPWLIGHPHRIGFLEELFAEIGERKDIWRTTTGQIAEHFLSHCDESRL